MMEDMLRDMADAGRRVLDGALPGEKPFKYISSKIHFICGRVNSVEDITFSEGSLSIALPSKKPALEEKLFIDYQVYIIRKSVLSLKRNGWLNENRPFLEVNFMQELFF